MDYMSIASNLYASKVFSEHPIASWPLDDDISYISLISETDRSFDSWTLTNATYTDLVGQFPDGPFPDNTFSELTAVDTNLVIEAISSSIFNLQDLNQELNTFAINMFLFTDATVNSYEYGFRYLDPFTGAYIESTRTVTGVFPSVWTRIGGTFNPPNVNANAQIILRITLGGAASPSIVMNGLSVGQWSETVNAKSLGVTPQLVSAELQAMIGAMSGCVVEAYGISQRDGYILEKNGRLLATNYGIPMVFGSDNVTRLVDGGGDPSVVIPGCGLLNESGKYATYTAEMWIRIENNSAEDRRIWGPLNSDYGLYVSRGYLTLLIGNTFGSYFISEWYRPMLVHVIIKENAASVLINGEEVISITFNTSELDLPIITEDWLGFYCYDNMPIYEIDCVSILPYAIPAAVAKRRFVWGQGVEIPEDINSAYDGVVSYIDYPYAQYTANQIFPDLSNWDSGYFENLVATRQSVSLPEYSLPQVELSEKTLQELYDDNYAIQETNHARYMSFRPNATWTNPAYYLFSNLNQINDVVRAVWGVFEINSEILEDRPLMIFKKISNPNDRIEITINGLTVSYKLYENNILYPTVIEKTVILDQHFTVGFDFPKLFETYGDIIGGFFGNPANVQLYIGGDGETTFEGYIYRVGFSNQTNRDEIQDYFYDDGIAIETDGDSLNDHLGSYTLLPVMKFNRFFLDIGVSAYWEEYFPLNLFAGYSLDSKGNTTYDVDFMQYNISYPTTSVVAENEVFGSWTYEELQESYALPVVRTYEALDNSLITGYGSYDDLQNNRIAEKTYDFSNSSVRTYLTFQRVSGGANRPLSDYSISQSIPSTNILDVPQYNDQFSTKFEIKDHSIIYPPKTFGVDDTAAVVHLDIKVNGIKSSPLRIRQMSLSSKTMNSTTFSEIGTRFGKKMYPYSKTGIYFDNKKNNPFVIGKNSTPYLYLTKTSGIESLGLREFNVERGISIPINESKATSSNVSALQIWLKYDADSLPLVPTPLFSLDALNTDISFNVVSDANTNRGRVYAVDQNTGIDYTALTFYQDGVQVMTPYIEKDKWTVIGIGFETPISFSNYTGAINLFQSATFNDIAYYRSSALQEVQATIYRKWEGVDGTPSVPLYWNYWKTYSVPNGSWNDVLKLAEYGIYGVSPEDIYKAYSGTNREVVDDNAGIVIQQSSTKIFASEVVDISYTTPAPTTRMTVINEPEWATYTRKPA